MGTKQKKIAFILPSLRGAGAERVFLNLSRSISEKGYDVDLVLLQKEGEYLNDVARGVCVVDLHCSRAALSFFALARYFKEENPDTAVSALPHMNAVTLAANRIAGTNVDIIITKHNPLSIDFSGINFLKRIGITFLMKSLYPSAKAIIAVSRGVAEDVSKVLSMPINTISIIYNPIVNAEIFVKAEEAPRHPWLVDKRAPIILSVGRLVPQKDFMTLIRAFAVLEGKNDARLIILGEGDERSRLERLVAELGLQERVSLPGFMKNPYAEMASADVFVLSSRWEGFGNVLVEAMACGTPVVSTSCLGGPAEIMEGGVYGKLVAPGDVVALAAAIEETLANPIDSETLRTRANVFSIESASAKYLEVIES